MYGFPIVKGLALGIITVAVVQSGLTPFQQALIIAVVSALIGALGVITAAVVSARANNEILDRQKTLAEQLADIKGAIGATKRQEDDSKKENC